MTGGFWGKKMSGYYSHQRRKKRFISSLRCASLEETSESGPLASSLPPPSHVRGRLPLPLPLAIRGILEKGRLLPLLRKEKEKETRHFGLLG